MMKAVENCLFPTLFQREDYKSGNSEETAKLELKKKLREEKFRRDTWEILSSDKTRAAYISLSKG